MSEHDSQVAAVVVQLAHGKAHETQPEDWRKVPAGHESMQEVPYRSRGDWQAVQVVGEPEHDWQESEQGEHSVPFTNVPWGQEDTHDVSWPSSAASSDWK